MATIIAYHGWGFDRNCWEKWTQHFSQQGHQVYCFDRGYFGHPYSPQFSHDRPNILLLHSFGLNLCSTDTIAAADIVVIFNSFLTFHPSEPSLQRRSRLIVQRMYDRCRTHPHTVLQSFWRNCYAPSPWSSHPLPPLNNLNQNLLLQDLERLNTVVLDAQTPTIQAIQHVPIVLVMHAAADQIVPITQGATLADAVATDTLITVPNAGHALPFSHLESCWMVLPFTIL